MQIKNYQTKQNCNHPDVCELKFHGDYAKKRRSKMGEKLRMAVLIVFFMSLPLILEAKVKVAIDTDISAASKYIWRGMDINNEFVLQPSFTAAVASFSFNVWGNMDTTNYGKKAGYGDQAGEFTEIDLTVNYNYSYDIFNLDGGIINYTFPDNVGESTYELYISTSLDTIFSPTVAVYYDFDEINGFYCNIGASHSFKILPEQQIDVVASIGYGSSNFNKGYFKEDSSGFVDFNIGASISYSINKHVTLKPFVTYSSIVDKDLRKTKTYKHNDNFYGGLSISASF